MGNLQNSLTQYLSDYVECIFTDIRYTYTENREMERDKARLVHEVRVRGSHVLTILLPAIAKALDKGLDDGLICLDDLYLCAKRRGEKIPVFLRDLFAQVFHPCDGKLRSEPSFRAVVDLRQLLLGGKKLLLPCSERKIRNEVRDFIKTESGNRRYTLDWLNNEPLSSDPRVRAGASRSIHLVDGLLLRPDDEHPQLPFSASPYSEECTDRELSLTQSVFDRVASELGDLTHEREGELPKHGPGAVSDLRRGMSKYQFRDWPLKLDYAFPFDAYAVHDFMCSEGIDAVLPGRDREVPSRLISVPKTQKSPRLIAAEPSQYQWVQQLVRNQLESRIKLTSLGPAVDFSSQVPNQVAAYEGSVNPETFVSIDLSSASDRLTCWLIERFARSNLTLLDRLHACRTRWNRNDVYPSEGQYTVLRKYATMGSAVVFPLQTIVYASLAVSAILISENRRVNKQSIEGAARRVRVFGDDILVPRHAFSVLQRLLVFTGLKINTTKTYTGGNFRESCGTEYFRGVLCTPAYLRQDFSRSQRVNFSSAVEVSNNFHRRGYWHVSRWIMSYYESLRSQTPVVGARCTQLGLFSFCGSSVNHLKRRWNAALHRYEVRVSLVSTKVRRTPGTARQNLMQWFIEKPRPDLLWKAGTDSAKVSTLRPGWQSEEEYLE